jgi:hypothetical protein
MRRALFLILLLAGAIVLSALAKGNARRVVDDCLKSQVQPLSIQVGCANANLSLTSLRWSSFGGVTAHGRGRYTFNSCRPDCARGQAISDPVVVVLSRPAICQDKFDDYRLATVTFGAVRPKATPAVYALALGCPVRR